MQNSPSEITSSDLLDHIRIELIPINKIALDPDNPRNLKISRNDIINGIDKDDPLAQQKLNDLKSLQLIAHSIKKKGLINPVIVYQTNDRYQLIVGERRVFASILAKRETIQAKILVDKPNNLEIRILQWSENVERKYLSLWERMNNVEQIIYEYAKQQNIKLEDVKIADISKLINCGKTQASHLKAILSAEDTLKEAIKNKMIKNLEKAALIAGIESAEIKKKAINECVNGATLNKLKKITGTQLSRADALEMRGRQTTSVNFGKTKSINVAKLIIYSILDNSKLSHLKSKFSNTDFANYRSIAQAFKNLVKLLEAEI